MQEEGVSLEEVSTAWVEAAELGLAVGEAGAAAAVAVMVQVGEAEAAAERLAWAPPSALPLELLPDRTPQREGETSSPMMVHPSVPPLVPPLVPLSSARMVAEAAEAAEAVHRAAEEEAVGEGAAVVKEMEGVGVVGSVSEALAEVATLVEVAKAASAAVGGGISQALAVEGMEVPVLVAAAMEAATLQVVEAVPVWVTAASGADFS